MINQCNFFDANEDEHFNNSVNMITLNGEDFEIIIQETPDYDNNVSVVLGTPEHVFEPGINYLYLVVVVNYVQMIIKLNEFKCIEICPL